MNIAISFQYIIHDVYSIIILVTVKETTMNKTNEEVNAGVTRHWNRVASQNNMTVDEYREYRKAQNEQRRKEWGLSMAAAITAEDAQSLQEYAESLDYAARNVLYDVNGYYAISREKLGEAICDLRDRLKLVTAVLDRIEENRD